MSLSQMLLSMGRHTSPFFTRRSARRRISTAARMAATSGEGGMGGGGGGGGTFKLMLWRPRTIHKRTAAAERGNGAPLRRTAHPQGFQAILLASATHHEQSCSISRPQHAAHAVPHDDDGDPDPAWNTCRQGGRPEREQARAGHCCALLGSMMRHQNLEPRPARLSAERALSRRVAAR
jgi:hypothetical protein